MEENYPVFEFKKVTKVYEGGPLVKALDSLSFKVYEGDTFGIIGEKGAGKSTLIRLFTRIEESTFGSIRFRGKKLSEMSPEEIREMRRRAATIISSLGLMGHCTVRQNLELAAKLFKVAPAEAESLISEVMEKCGISAFENVLTHELSPADRVLTAVARALLGKPECLIFDEADAPLSDDETDRVAEIIKKLKKENSLTLIIATGKMRIVESLCNHAMVLETGHLVECGGVLDIIKSPSSAAAKKLVYPENTPLEQYDSQGKRCVRIAFDGTAAKEPVIAALVEETGEKVSILCANTKSIGGIGFGQMIVELPDDTIGAQKVINYFKQKGVFVEVVKQWQL